MGPRQSSHISVGKLRGLGSFRPLCSAMGKHNPWTTLLLCCSAAHPALSAAGTLCLPSPMVARQRELGSSDWHLLSKQLIQSLTILQLNPTVIRNDGRQLCGSGGQSSHCFYEQWGCTRPCPCLRCPWGSLWEQLRAAQAPAAPGALRVQLLCAADGRTLLTGSMGSPAGAFTGGSAGGQRGRTWALLIPSAQPKALEQPLHRRDKAQGLHKADLTAWKNRNQDLDKSKQKLKLCRK